MADYGHDLLFGAFPAPYAAQHEQLLRLGADADDLGLDLLGIQDHPYQPRFLDAWTLLSVIAARTRRIRLFLDVANLPLRPPSVLARSVASLDVLSGGRVELGLGAGAFWEAIEANGGPRRSAREAVDALAEAIAVIRALWVPGAGVRLPGEHYRLAGAKPGPVPAHDVGIWVGAIGPRMLDVTGRLADGWVPSSPYVPPARLAELNARIDAAAEAAGRDPAAIRRVYNVMPGDGFLDGPTHVWVEELARLAVEDGMSGFVLAFGEDPSRDLRRLAEEVAPGVRAAVAAERHRGDPTGAS